MNITAIILARGGSTRIHNKNIALLAGKSLLQHTIEQAQASRHINRIIVTSNDKHILNIAKGCGADTIRRPDKISQPHSREYQAFRHALRVLSGRGCIPDIIVKLPVTSPFRKPSSIDNCIDLLLSNPSADSVRSVRLCKEHPYKMWTIENDRLKTIIPSYRLRLSQAHTRAYQELPKIYVNNASIDVIWTSTILAKRSVTGNHIIPYIMSEEESFDINTPLDLEQAELIAKRHNKNKHEATI